MDDVLVFEGTPLVVPPGGTVLIDTDAGPMLAIAPREGFEDAVLGFLLVEQVGGDTFSANELADPAELPDVRAERARTTWAAAARCSPKAASGRARSVPLENRFVGEGDLGGRARRRVDDAEPAYRPGKFSFSGTDELGVYEVQSGGKTVQRFAVNLFDPMESNLPPRKKFDVGPVEIEGRSGWEVVRREMWRWLLLAGLVRIVFGVVYL